MQCYVGVPGSSPSTANAISTESGSHSTDASEYLKRANISISFGLNKATKFP